MWTSSHSRPREHMGFGNLGRGVCVSLSLVPARPTRHGTLEFPGGGEGRTGIGFRLRVGRTNMSMCREHSVKKASTSLQLP